MGDTSSPNQITRTWANLIPHYSITVTAKLYKIDSWVNNTIFFMVDGVTAQLYTFTAANGGTTDFCGNPTPVPDSINTSFNDLIVPVSFTVPHTASGLTLKIISNLVSSSGSWGIRDLMITMEACDESCLTCTTGSKSASIQLHAPVAMADRDSSSPEASACARAGIGSATFPARLRRVLFVLWAVARTHCNNGMM